MTTEPTCTHPCAELLAPLAQGQLGAEDSGRVLEHVERCPACSRELDFLADVVNVAGADAPRAAEPASGPAAAPPPPAGRVIRVPFGLLGGLAAAAALLIVVLPMLLDGGGASNADALAQLARWERPRYDAVRSVDPFEEAMRLYQEGRFAEHEAALTELLDTADEPDVLALYFRAASRVELGRVDQARDDLLAASQVATGLWRARVAWSLANVHLLLGEDGAALALLDALAAGDDALRLDAAELAAEVRATAGG